MPDPDLYVGLAGVAVVFAGFSGISAVLTGRQPDQWREVDAARLSSMIGLSLVGAFFSLLPVVVARLVTSTELIWQLCSALFLAVVVAGNVRGYFLIRRIYLNPDTDRDTGRGFAITGALVLLEGLALTASTFRLVPALSEGFYLVALMCQLGLAAHIFIRTLTVLRTAGGE
jgi:hypothetical protein